MQSQAPIPPAGNLHRGAVLGILLGTFLLAGCSTFNRDWEAAAAQPAATGDLTGAWDGTWQSDFNGHSGRLRCLITTSTNGQHLARFHAKYRKILGFGYDVPLRVRQPQPKVFTFEGEADLGRLAGGMYRYNGQATPVDFFSTYRSNMDFGWFKLRRPERK